MGKITGKKIAGWVGMTLGVVVGVAIGTTFITGGFMNQYLSWITLTGHKIIGWVIAGGSVLSYLMALLSKK